MHFLSKPNLPQNKIKHIIIGEHQPVIDMLNKLGTEVFILDNNRNIQTPVQAHADMTVLHLGGNKFLSYDYKTAEKLNQMGANCRSPKKEQCRNYPQDIAVNALIIGNFIICNTKYCADEIVEHAKFHCMKLINTSQGYARCSVAVIDESSVITADKDIAAKMSGEGFDVLQIRPGYISLPGYDYGFIGGCCGKIDKDKILFCGDINTHPDAEQIIEFIKARKIEIITIGHGRLFDFGGFISVDEE